MNQVWLYKKLSYEDIERVRFKFLGSVHWAHGLSNLCKQNIGKILNFYDGVGSRHPPLDDITSIFNSLLMSLHYLDALKCISNHKNEHQCISRVAVIAWYYGVYYSSKAMLVAVDGSNPEKHRKTASEWYIKIVRNNLAIHPFDYHLDSLVKKTYEEEINKNPFRKSYLNKNPADNSSSEGICCSYLKGTADWYREGLEKIIKETKQYKSKRMDKYI